MIRVLLYEQVPRPESRAAIIAVSPRRSQKAHPKGELARLCALIALPLSGRGACSYRTPRTACPFRAHFNIWWARHGWPLIHLVPRPASLFSRPPYFPAGVNLTAEFPSEPPRGGEHGAGDKMAIPEKIIRGIPKLSKIIVCVSRRQWQQQTPLALGETSSARKHGNFPYIAYPKAPELSKPCGRTANRLFFGSFALLKRKNT